MQVIVSPKDENNMVSVKVETAPGRARLSYDKTLRELGKQVNIKGFRKGKVPTKMLEEYIGPSNIRAEVLSQEFLSEILQEAFKAENLEVVNIEKLERVEFEDPDSALTLEASVELFPNIELADIKDFILEVKVPKYDAEQEFQETIDNLVKEQTKYEITSSPIEMNFEINFNFEGSYLKDDNTWEAKDGMKAENYSIVVQSGRFIDNFLEQTVGMSAGDEKEIEVKFPDEYFDEDLKGKPAKFKIKINSVSAPVAPTLDDNLAQIYSFNTLEELYERIRKEGSDLRQKVLRQMATPKVLDLLAEKSQVNLSQGMIEREIEHGLAVKQYQQNWTDEEVKEYYERMDKDAEKEKVKETLTKSVIISKIIKDQQFEASQEEIKKAFRALNIEKYMDPSKIDFKSLFQRLNMDIVSEKAIQYVLDNAKSVIYLEVEPEELEEEHGHVHGPNCNH